VFVVRGTSGETTDGSEAFLAEEEEQDKHIDQAS
jgi:hypothetical protein